MLRALFEKTGTAVYISHLDLMRLFQRAFKRAGLSLTHSHGFNPRPSVSIAMPMSLGMESQCELLDFDLEERPESLDLICQKLNDALIPGVRVRKVYEGGQKLKNLAYLDCCLTLEYDRGVPANGLEELKVLFSRESLPVQKKGKNGMTEQDIVPLIRRLELAVISSGELEIRARICCQNPNLNPMQLVAAVNCYLPELAPDFVRCCRTEIYDTEESVFR